MRFENLHWTPIDAPAKGLTFKELNSESTEQKPVLENTDNQKSESKAKILESTLIQGVLTMMRNKNKVVSEATQVEDPDQRPTELTQTASWKDFRLMGQTIGGFLTDNKNGEIEKALKQVEEIFQALGDGDPSNGVDKLIKIDSALIDAGINGNVKPAINAARFMDILKDDIYKKRGEHITKHYDVSTLIEILLTRQKRRISSFLAKCETEEDAEQIIKGQLLETIKKAIGTREGQIQSGGNKQEKVKAVADILLKVMKANWYEKNGGKIGKGEIALAMFFGDCHLADQEGDLEIGTTGSNKVEVKGNEAVITQRIGWNDFKQTLLKTNSDTFSNNSEMEKKLMKGIIAKYKDKATGEFNGNDLNAIFNDIRKLNITSEASPSRRIGKGEIEPNGELDSHAEKMNKKQKQPKQNQNLNIDELCFKAAFAFTFRNYMWNKVKGRMMIINTKDRVAWKDLENPETALFMINIPVILKVNSTDWFSDGLNALKQMKSKNIQTYFGIRAANEGGFKVRFKTAK